VYNGVNVNIGLGDGVGPFEMHSVIEGSTIHEYTPIEYSEDYLNDPSFYYWYYYYMYGY
jgi:hypothetical protein